RTGVVTHIAQGLALSGACDLLPRERHVLSLRGPGVAPTPPLLSPRPGGAVAGLVTVLVVSGGPEWPPYPHCSRPAPAEPWRVSSMRFAMRGADGAAGRGCGGRPPATAPLASPAPSAPRPAAPAAGAGGVRQRDARPIAARAAQRFPHRVRHAPQPPLDAGAQMRSRVNHHAAEPQRLAALELVGERIDGLAPGRRLRGCQVDEIARVGEHGRDA